MEGILLALLFAVFIYGFRQQLKLDAFQAFFYFYLFIYGIFALIGYVYRPMVSELISAYFGPDIAAHAIIFIILSMLGVSFGLQYISPKISKLGHYIEIKKFEFNRVTAVLIVSSIFIAAQVAGLLKYWSKLSYSNASDVDLINSADLGYSMWFILYHITVVFIVIFYALIRYNIWKERNLRNYLVLITALIAAIFFIIVYRVANRGEVLSLFNGIIFVEFVRYRKFKLLSRPPIAKGLILAVVMIVYGEIAKDSRGEDQSERLDWLSALVYQDYYAPAHMLFAAISYHMIDPLLVIASNTANIVPGYGVPYLQYDVTNLFNSGLTTRASSYAFYILTEGYLFCGDMGFIYNSIVISCGVGLWRLLSNTRSAQFNALMLPVMALDVASLSRGQSAYFIKGIYFHTLPALLMIFFTTGYFFSGLRRRN